MVGQIFAVTCESLSTIGLFAAGHIDREEALTRLKSATWSEPDAAAALDCVDFVGLEHERR